jgi:serine/threonine protein kinase
VLGWGVAGGMSLPPGINIRGVKAFMFADLARATNDFNADHELGQGGYGKVYKGVLADGTTVAIKRAQEGSMQGATQFYTEIELLSRVHHRNLVELLGYCNDVGEQVRNTCPGFGHTLVKEFRV